MKIILLNVQWLIIVSVISINGYSQITLDPSNKDELRISCDEIIDLAPPIAKTNCEGDLNFSFSDKLYSGGCMGTIERIWVISDKCNNSARFTQYISQNDKVPPTLSNYPEDITVEKNIPEIEILTAVVNCDQNLKVIFSEEEINDDNGNLKFINRNWMVTDKCGNLTQHQQVISMINKDI